MGNIGYKNNSLPQTNCLASFQIASNPFRKGTAPRMLQMWALTIRVSTEFRRHGIPRNFLTSEVISAQFRIPRNAKMSLPWTPYLRYNSDISIAIELIKFFRNIGLT
jgi:hypothetical protein